MERTDDSNRALQTDCVEMLWRNSQKILPALAGFKPP